MENEQRKYIAIRAQRVAAHGVSSGAHKLNNWCGASAEATCMFMAIGRWPNTAATSPSQKSMRITVAVIQ